MAEMTSTSTFLSAGVRPLPKKKFTRRLTNEASSGLEREQGKEKEKTKD
jgi:hypothetical protein